MRRLCIAGPGGQRSLVVRSFVKPFYARHALDQTAPDQRAAMLQERGVTPPHPLVGHHYLARVRQFSQQLIGPGQAGGVGVDQLDLGPVRAIRVEAEHGGLARADRQLAAQRELADTQRYKSLGGPLNGACPWTPFLMAV